MEQEFDAPIFKILAHNDTGQAVGHQGGIVIPKDLEPYFPQLSRHVTAERPTVDQLITAHMFDGSIYVGSAETRYQFQTWGGTRSPERRITGNITPLRNLAKAGDLLLIQRGVVDDSQYRLTLVRKETPQFAANSHLFAESSRRWGVLHKGSPPVREVEVERALEQIEEHEQTPFGLFDDNAELVESRTRRVARSRAFQARVVAVYGRKCAFCGNGFAHPNGKCEAEAAHIVPRRLKGCDDARNGLLLCKSHHWAFDAGLVGVSEHYQIIVPDSVLNIPSNQSLALLKNSPIRLPADPLIVPNLEALAWHEANILIS